MLNEFELHCIACWKLIWILYDEIGCAGFVELSIEKGQQLKSRFGRSYFYGVKWRVNSATCKNMV